MSAPTFTTPGTFVEGTYCGVPFTGTVSGSRPLNHYTQEVEVDLDAPITITGRTEEKGVVLYVTSNGRNSENYIPGGGNSIRVR